MHPDTDNFFKGNILGIMNVTLCCDFEVYILVAPFE